MQFGNYIWAQPPQNVEIRYSRKTQSSVDENGALTFTDLGCIGRVVEAEGTFSGENAYEYFSPLAELFEAGKAAVFQMEPYKPMTALMTELTVAEEPCENFLHYRFRLQELPTQST